MVRRRSRVKGRSQKRARIVKRLESELARLRALEALSEMREQRKSLTQAARAAQTTPRTVKRHVAPALRKTRTGRYKPTPSDRLPRSLRFLTPEGIISVEVGGSRAASEIARHWAAVDRYLRTGQTDALREFRGRAIRVGKGRYPFVTDPRTLGRLARAGEVSFEDLYALTL